jgi:hypothetical protein
LKKQRQEPPALEIKFLKLNFKREDKGI